MVSEAEGVADEQIAWWRARGIEPQEAWRMLSPEWGYENDWHAVRTFMVRWLAHHQNSVARCNIVP